MTIKPERFMRWAQDVATDSTCAKIKVGAILVSPRGQIISTGFNGSLPGQEHCCDHFVGEISREALGEDEFLKQHRIFSIYQEIHAEENCIEYAERSRLPGATLFVTHSPCPDCCKRILLAKISRVFYGEIYDGEAIRFLEQFIPVEQV